MRPIDIITFATISPIAARGRPTTTSRRGRDRDDPVAQRARGVPEIAPARERIDRVKDQGHTHRAGSCTDWSTIVIATSEPSRMISTVKAGESGPRRCVPTRA